MSFETSYNKLFKNKIAKHLSLKGITLQVSKLSAWYEILEQTTILISVFKRRNGLWDMVVSSTIKMLYILLKKLLSSRLEAVFSTDYFNSSCSI